MTIFGKVCVRDSRDFVRTSNWNDDFHFVRRALFTSPLNDGTQSEVSIRDIRSPIMQNIIDYAYSEVAEIDEDNVTEVLTWAHYFGYDELVDICSAFIMKNLNTNNCISYMLHAR